MKVRARLATVTAALLCASPWAPARAERPMAVDDAGTLERYGTKLEVGWSRDDHARGVEAAVGFGPLENVEIELGFGYGRDRHASPDETFRLTSAALKWVPLQPETGLSAGLRFEIGHKRIDDGPGRDLRTDSRAILGLLQWRFQSGSQFHLNLGRDWVRESGQTEALDTWGLGLAQPLSGGLVLTAEVFGAEAARPDRQLGLRYEIAEGLKVSAAAGRGNTRSFASAGIAWEF